MSRTPAVRHVYERLPSTNDQAWDDGREAFRDNGMRFLCVVADEQTSGRGRAGRAWASPPGSGLYLSCYCRLDWPPDLAAMLTLAAGMAVRDAVTETVQVTPHLKWPNDLLAPDGSGRKFGGILTETRVEGSSVSEAVIGIGLNLFPPEKGWDTDAAARPAALAEFAPRDRIPAAREFSLPVMSKVRRAVERMAEQGAGDLVERARDAMPLWGRRVSAAQGRREVVGVARDLAQDGGLVVRLDSGAEVVVHAGDVRVVWGEE